MIDRALAWTIADWARWLIGAGLVLWGVGMIAGWPGAAVAFGGLLLLPELRGEAFWLTARTTIGSRPTKPPSAD